MIRLPAFPVRSGRNRYAVFGKSLALLLRRRRPVLRGIGETVHLPADLVYIGGGNNPRRAPGRAVRDLACFTGGVSGWP